VLSRPIVAASRTHIKKNVGMSTICSGFYARQHVMLSASLLRQRRPSVCLSVRLSHCCIVSKRRNLASWNLQSLVSNEVILVPLGEEIPLERGHQRGVPPLEIVILPLLAHLAWKRLQIDTDLLLIITSTADELSSGTNIGDLERRWTAKIGFLLNF